MAFGIRKGLGFSLAGLCFALSGLIWVFAGNTPIAMMNVAIGMMFVVLGVTKQSKTKQGETGSPKEEPGSQSG